jgi:hypothetical protein
MKTRLSARRSRYLAMFSVLLMMTALVAGMAGCDGYTPPQDLEIRTWYDLDEVRNNLAGHHILMNDLSSTTPGYEELAGPTGNEGMGWVPIGTEDDAFTGTLDGQGYEIRNLFINRPDDSEIGLFGYIDEGGIIKNISVTNAAVTSSNSVDSLGALTEDTVSNLGGYLAPGGIIAVLVGRSLGTVSNCYASGNVSGDWAVGGLVGQNQGVISNSYFEGSVSGDSGAGGLVGFNRGIVSNSYYNCDEVFINGENMITIGALFNEDFEQWLANGKFLDFNDRLSQEDGYHLVNNVTDFKQLLAFGQNPLLRFRLANDLDLATESNFYIPYFAGEFDGNGHRISNLGFNSNSASQVALFGYLAYGGAVHNVGAENVNIHGCNHVGGLVGLNDGTVNESYSTGSVAGEYDVGGLIGWNSEGTVNNSHSSGIVTGSWGIGGLLGHNRGTVSKSYATSNVTGSSVVGGLVGYNEATVSSSFWDTQTSGQVTSDGGTGKTTEEMRDVVTFSGAGWDIMALALNETNTAYIWNIVNNVTYPFLSWQSL